ncbi:MotA/TolQ/ExbB proton channel family protein [Alterisphingorhabdus coralli]|uniref:MotA/TolQ/ExbB proton channel family protein n=1 Tax=Alterisphingorhabdus coralli TaxID=3071408 RepID=A0AA97F7M0_9SPHN|nr:MotA/TolQ/ExbB proton channel family protein [Parasphingorhabdus sp. SCSIO 66989]WOE74752.1 MotA/TolQ/ExbB proton channel family protein [Parasphingorhabdus sp. SCSIO 66989]
MAGQIMMFFDPLSLLLVILVSVVIAWVQNGSAGAWHGLSVLPVLLSRNAEDVAERARLAMVRVEQRVEENGPFHADRIAPDIPYIASLAEMLANSTSWKEFSEATQPYRQRQHQKRESAIGFWSDMAEVAPAIGMIGTVVGLIIMFDGITSADAIGEAMAVCLLTSLYGLLLAHVVANPIARRTELYANQEKQWQDDFARRFGILARKHLDGDGVVLNISDSAKVNGLTGPKPAKQLAK